MKYIIETGYPKNTFRTVKVFTPGWYGSEPYLSMGQPYTDGIGQQHVDLRIERVSDDVDGNKIAMAHVPPGYTLVSHVDIDRVIKLLEDGSEERAIETLRTMRKEDGRKYYANSPKRKPK